MFLALTGAERAAGAVVAALCGDEREAFAAYARWRERDVAWRRRLGRAVSLLVDVPPLARRASSRLRRFPAAGATLIDALAGAIPPQSAFRPGVLGRLFA